MSCLDDNINVTGCPAADHDFDFSDYLNICTVCIAGNTDVAGLGILTGIILQAALMNVFVLLWWGAGPGCHRTLKDFVDLYRWCTRAAAVVFYRPNSIWGNIKAAWTLIRKDFNRFGEKIMAVAEEDNPQLDDVVDGTHSAIGADHLLTERSDVKSVVATDLPIRNNVESINSSHKNRKILQKIFRTFSDTQAVTGVALLLAALVQGDCLSLYHTAILIDLISISADGQAIMLFYSYRNFSVDNPFAPLRADSGIRVRLLSSALFLVLYFVFAFKGYFRYRDTEECLLITTNGRNSGAWGIATAVLVLVVYLPIFVPRKWQESTIKSGEAITKRVFTVFYHKDAVDRQGNPEGTPEAKKSLKEKFFGVFLRLRLTLAWMIYALGKAFLWLYRRELIFPIASWTYFIWNAIDIGQLKRANAVLLIDGGAEERNFGAFGQIVPIVMGVALAFPIYDVLQESAIS